MSFNVMTIVYVLFVILYLAFIYYRMIKREIPKPIGWLMALVPIAFGMATFDISCFTGIKLYLGNATMQNFVAKLPAVIGSLLGAFLGAGLPEEIFKGMPSIPEEYKPILKIINKKPIMATEKELMENSRSHSAKLRIGEKLWKQLKEKN